MPSLDQKIEDYYNALTKEEQSIYWTGFSVGSHYSTERDFANLWEAQAKIDYLKKINKKLKKEKNES